MTEPLLSWAAVLLLALALTGWRRRWGLAALELALLALLLMLALRWVRLGHGPFISLHEILASSMLSLGLVWRLALWREPLLRPTALPAWALLLLMGVWLLVTPARDTHLPATYETAILWVHVLLGKIFLGLALVASALAGVLLLRGRARLAQLFATMPADAVLEAWAWRFLYLALLFESLMLIAGAVWAQDAWGRYWAWDPLETWAFLTWLALAGALHARLTWPLGAQRSALLVLGVFMLAFLTFFGMPFVSTAPHQGAV
ncbi:MAG: cytochrome c biogenesis protein [Leptothrix sp. (in: b-proteobacteria)]